MWRLLLNELAEQRQGQNSAILLHEEHVQRSQEVLGECQHQHSLDVINPYLWSSLPKRNENELDLLHHKFGMVVELLQCSLTLRKPCSEQRLRQSITCSLSLWCLCIVLVFIINQDCKQKILCHDGQSLFGPNVVQHRN